jgi:hypothetical protein
MVKKQTTTTTARKANTATLLDDLNGYDLVEKHRTSTRRRVVDHWRIIGDWTEADQVLASTPWSLPSGAFQTCGGPN